MVASLGWERDQQAEQGDADFPVAGLPARLVPLVAARKAQLVSCGVLVAAASALRPLLCLAAANTPAPGADKTLQDTCGAAPTLVTEPVCGRVQDEDADTGPAVQ